MLLGGGGLFLGTAGAFIGPGHAGIFSYAGRDWFSCHFYDGTHGGRSTLAVLPLTWGADGWPAIEKDHPAAGKNRLTEPALTPSASPVPADRTP